MATIIDKILAEVCLDERVSDGVFDMSNADHMQALFEQLTDNFGFNLEDSKNIHNKMIEGKYPERQAYNKDGLLVTFPTPEHKQRAIRRGTHFEKDPNKGPTNIYGSQPQMSSPSPSSIPSSSNTPDQKTSAQPVTNSSLPASEVPSQMKAVPQAQPQNIPPSSAVPPAPAAPAAPPAPPLPPSPLPVEPQASEAGEQASLKPVNYGVPKSPEIRASEAQLVKQIMSGDPNSLNEQFEKLEKFCLNENLNEALSIIRHIKTIDTILSFSAKR